MPDSTLLIGPDTAELAEEAFRGREDIAAVSFHPDCKVTTIPTGAFRDCPNLKRVSLPESLRKIGAHAFAYCGALSEISFPDSLKTIGHNAFSLCQSLDKVAIPDSVTELESYAFSDCTSLREAKLPANPSLLGELIFSGCRNLETLTAPSSVPPPFDCNSFIFEPEETGLYTRCKLVTPTQELYKTAHGWSLFRGVVGG